MYLLTQLQISIEVNFILNTENVAEYDNPEHEILKYGFGFELGPTILCAAARGCSSFLTTINNVLMGVSGSAGFAHFLTDSALSIHSLAIAPLVPIHPRCVCTIKELGS